MASTDEKKRTQEASETDFTTRGGRQDATSGTGKPHTSPCKRAPEMPDEAGTVNGEQAPAASLAWVLTTCAETVVECTDKEDFGDACVAVGPGLCSQLQTETVPRLLLRENRELVIEQGRGWAENDQPFALTVAQHLAAVREWIAFEEDGRGISAEKWVQEDINRNLEAIQAWKGHIKRYDPDNPLPYQKKDPRPEYEKYIRDYEERLKLVWERGFETAPADPRRAALLSRLEATVYCHGAIHVPADLDSYSSGHEPWSNSKETSVVVSLGAPDGRRTLFVCSAAEGNICEPGCWKEPQFARSMMSSCGESPRGILKSLKKKVSQALEPAALESLPRLVGALPGSYYLHDIIDEIDEAHYQRELKQFKKYSPD